MCRNLFAEAKTFFYGVFTILRRTMFVVIAQVAEPRLQSCMSLALITMCCALHLKLEPYKRFTLDQFDFVLLVVLCVMATSSLAFQPPPAALRESELFFKFWEWLVYIFVVISILAAILMIGKEVQLKILNLRADSILPVQHRGLHRTILQFVRREKSSALEAGAAVSYTRVAVTNRGNMVEVPILSIFRHASLRKLVIDGAVRDQFLAAVAEVP